VSVTFQLPEEVEQKLRAQSADLEGEAKEAYALELFRQKKLTHFELSKVLGMDRFQTDAYLKQKNIFEGSLTMEDLDADRETIERVLHRGQ